MDTDFKLACQFGSIHNIGQRPLFVLGCVGFTKYSRMNLNEIYVNLMGNFYLVWIRIDKNAIVKDNSDLANQK